MFAATRTTEPGALAALVLRNVGSLGLAAAAANALLRRWVLGLEGPRAVAAHAGLAAAFSLGWLWLLTVAAGLMQGAGPTSFQVSPLLVGYAEAWQLFQGLAVYAALVAWTLLDVRAGAPDVAAGLVVIDGRAGLPPERFLVREGEGARPLAADDIVTVTGADDYAELLTVDGATRLVDTTLAAFEAELDPKRFVRVHRSAIVNLDRLVRADGAGGGRMLLHMAAGPPVPASRAGAKALRERLL